MLRKVLMMCKFFFAFLFLFLFVHSSSCLFLEIDGNSFLFSRILDSDGIMSEVPIVEREFVRVPKIGSENVD